MNVRNPNIQIPKNTKTQILTSSVSRRLVFGQSEFKPNGIFNLTSLDHFQFNKKRFVYVKRSESYTCTCIIFSVRYSDVGPFSFQTVSENPTVWELNPTQLSEYRTSSVFRHSLYVFYSIILSWNTDQNFWFYWQESAIGKLVILFSSRKSIKAKRSNFLSVLLREIKTDTKSKMQLNFIL